MSSHMCVVVTGWPYSSARLIMPLKQAPPTQRENSSFVIIDMCFCNENSSFVDKRFKRMFVAESCVCGFMFTRQCRVYYIDAWNSVVANN